MIKLMIITNDSQQIKKPISMLSMGEITSMINMDQLLLISYKNVKEVLRCHIRKRSAIKDIIVM
jgi:hypothetical protein